MNLKEKYLFNYLGYRNHKNWANSSIPCWTY